MTDPSGTTSYSYDSRDRLISKATPEGTLTYSYDQAGNLLLTQSSNTNGVNVSYSYDKLNRLAMATDNAPLSGVRPATGTTTYGYDPVGNLSGYLYPNRIQTSYSYNSLNRLANMTVAKGTGSSTTNLASYAYTLGPAGNRTSVVELSGRTVNYGYDDVYRLTSETISSDATTSNNGSISYQYDAVGNRLSRNSTIAAVPSATSTYNANDQLGSDTYDNNGSTTVSGGKTYLYDLENHIIAVNPGTPGAITQLYDGDGSRVSKTVNGITTRYLVDDNNPTGYEQAAEELSNGSVARTYAYGRMLISESQVISDNWSTSFYGLDGHESLRFLTSSTGSVTDTYDYDAFGILVHQVGSTPNLYLYSSEQFDPDLGLYYERARYLNTFSGRFWTVDSFEGEATEPLSLHKYLYVSASPVNKIDRNGHEETTLIGQVGSLQVDAVLEKIEIDTALAGIAAETAAEAVFGYYTYFLGVLILAAALSQSGDNHPQPDTKQDDDDKEQILYRFGYPRESAAELEDQSFKAESILGIHGVSVRSRPGRYPSPSAPRRVVEAHFRVFKTAQDPYHYTVELPTPVTDKDAELFNDIFGRKK